MWDNAASYGAKLQNLRYASLRKPAGAHLGQANPLIHMTALNRHSFIRYTITENVIVDTRNINCAPPIRSFKAAWACIVGVVARCTFFHLETEIVAHLVPR